MNANPMNQPFEVNSQFASAVQSATYSKSPVSKKREPVNSKQVISDIKSQISNDLLFGKFRQKEEHLFKEITNSTTELRRNLSSHHLRNAETISNFSHQTLQPLSHNE